MKERALTCEIFKSHFGDCSNGGISSKYNEVYLLCPQGNVEIDLDNPPENLVKLERRELWGEKHYYIRPYKDCPSNKVGYMMGGTFIYTCDSRFSEYCEIHNAIQFNDRTETQRECNMYSS